MRRLYIALPYFLCGLMDVLTGLLRGMGSSTLPMIITVGGVCGLRIFWIYTVFAAYPSITVLYLIHPISWIVTTMSLVICFAVFYKKEKRRFDLITT
jgi:Na+-driven multidrug efflux pump